ncbi:hypothetical protein Tco_0347295 [Tanacetum coccineum]
MMPASTDKEVRTLEKGMSCVYCRRCRRKGSKLALPVLSDFGLKEAETRSLYLSWALVFVHKRDTPDKLEQRICKGIFIGIPKNNDGYYFYFPPEKKIVVASHDGQYGRVPGRSSLVVKTLGAGKPHWTVVKNILKYLRNTKDMFLVYGGNPSTELRVECYCDAGFETDRDDTKSQTGYVFVLNGGVVD